MAIKTSNSKGSALIQVIIVLVVFSVIGISIMTLSTSERWMGERDNRLTQAYYYARSGVDMARTILAAATPPDKPFYFYGSLNSIAALQANSTYQAGTNTTVDSSEIVVYVHDVNGKLTIDSIGNVSGVKKTLTNIVTVSSTEAGEPQIPDVSTGGAANGSSSGEDAVKWFDFVKDSHYGRLLGKEDNVEDVAVIMDYQGSIIYKQEGYDQAFTAPAIYFTKGTGLEVKQDLYFKANFLYFAGPITMDHGEKKNVKDQLFLKTNGSQIMGQTIGGLNYNYGLIYIGSTIEGQDIDEGFYYFRDGTDLLHPGFKDLIPVPGNNIDIPVIKNSLNYTVTISNGQISDVLK